jgi:hypothetical protein
MSKYGMVQKITGELWAKHHRYNKISTGVRDVQLNLKMHVPSQLLIAGNKTIVAYDGQVQKCFSCHNPGHVSQMCPHKRSSLPTNEGVPKQVQEGTGASIVKSGQQRDT